MTNEEAIEQLKFLKKVDNHIDTKEAVNIILDIIQENTKLKAEIDRLNGKSEMYRDMADSFCNNNIKLKAEIEQLKSTISKMETTTAQEDDLK